MKPHTLYTEQESQFECFASVPSTIVFSLLLKQRKQMHPEKMCINKNFPGKLSVKAKLWHTETCSLNVRTNFTLYTNTNTHCESLKLNKLTSASMLHCNLSHQAAGKLNNGIQRCRNKRVILLLQDKKHQASWKMYQIPSISMTTLLYRVTLLCSQTVFPHDFYPKSDFTALVKETWHDNRVSLLASKMWQRHGARVHRLARLPAECLLSDIITKWRVMFRLGRKKKIRWVCGSKWKLKLYAEKEGAEEDLVFLVDHSHTLRNCSHFKTQSSAF